MNLVNTPARKWAVVALAGALLITAVSWTLLVSGKKSDASSFTAQAADAQIGVSVAHSAVLQLQAQNSKLPLYKAQLAKLQAALPQAPDTAQLVTDLQQRSNAAGVSITQITVTPPTTTSVAPVVTPSTSSSSSSAATIIPIATGPAPLPITLTASGTSIRLERFVDQLQRVEPRALVLSSVIEAAGAAGSGTSSTLPTMTITMNAFYQTAQ